MIRLRPATPVSATCRTDSRWLIVCGLLASLAVTSLIVPTTAFAQAAEEPAEEPEEEEPEEKKSVGKHIFIKLEPLISPILDDRSIKGKITLVLKLHLVQKGVEEKVRHRIPQLNDAYLNYMYRYGSSAASTGVMQLESLLGTLQRLSDKILGKDVVKVLLDEVSRTRSN
jgi:flagellar basal body-associated protein FliL